MSSKTDFFKHLFGDAQHPDKDKNAHKDARIEKSQENQGLSDTRIDARKDVGKNTRKYVRKTQRHAEVYIKRTVYIERTLWKYFEDAERGEIQGTINEALREYFGINEKNRG